ncbi:hypothetical protein BST92_05925 [Nonlabens arenilitoris]|uniref:Outer membrane protein beta-barrel domain-containing protein n=1 Tax=Nonlabens arenilitoris TaxID=1217969 RepID=A0A2S7UA34_9FLAO|nr:hypothetical protein [Nonlabens arenilitoris]PQJ31490.1 hypothetical protein BST92_05925 [Nonlabens arenilitoris]
MKHILAFTAVILLAFYSNAQRRQASNNRLGIALDATFFSLNTDDVAVDGKVGWSAGLETRGSSTPYWDMIFGIHLFNNKFSVQEALTLDEIDMSVIGAEVKLLWAYKIDNREYLSLEIGPAVSFNGEFKVADKRYEDSVITGSSAVTVSSFQETSPVNINGIVGLSGGLDKIRFSAHYHYAFLDVLNGKNALSEELNGNMSYITAGVRFYF